MDRDQNFCSEYPIYLPYIALACQVMASLGVECGLSRLWHQQPKKNCWIFVFGCLSFETATQLFYAKKKEEEQKKRMVCVKRIESNTGSSSIWHY